MPGNKLLVTLIHYAANVKCFWNFRDNALVEYCNIYTTVTRAANKSKVKIEWTEYIDEY